MARAKAGGATSVASSRKAALVCGRGAPRAGRRAAPSASTPTSSARIRRTAATPRSAGRRRGGRGTWPRSSSVATWRPSTQLRSRWFATIAPVTTTLVSCVAENSDRWYQEAQSLVLSVRRFGGTLSDASIVVNFVDSVEPRYENGLAELGADVRVVTRFDRRTPASATSCACWNWPRPTSSTCCWRSTPTRSWSVTSAYADPAAVAVKPENLDLFPPRCWRHLFAEPGLLDEPVDRHHLDGTGHLPVLQQWRAVRPPRSLPGPAGELVQACVRRSRPVRPAAGHRRPTTASLDQPVVPGACRRRGRHPVACLPVAANLSTTVRVHLLFAHEVTPPFVLHYHNEMDADGFYLPVPQRRPQPCHRCRQPGPRVPGFGLRGHAGPTPGPRTLRRVEGRSWYESGPLAHIRRHRLLAPVRRQAKRLAKGPAGG